MKTKIGEVINFKRNMLIFGENVKVVALAPELNNLIIENPHGWHPDANRLLKYKLDPKKKYLFIRESELLKVFPKVSERIMNHPSLRVPEKVIKKKGSKVKAKKILPKKSKGK